MTAKKQTKGQTVHHIYPDWCKGCGICLAFCPQQVLELSEEGKARVAKPEECVNCGFCERHCPDFAIVVKPAGRRKRLVEQLEEEQLEEES
nr:4Fe-4S dicluster domain-containing protein [Desulfohalovibrio reitneri]